MNKVENFIISSKIIYFISSLLIVILGLKYFKKTIEKEDILLILLLTIIIYVFLEYLVKVISEKKLLNRINNNFIEGFENPDNTYTMITNPDGTITFRSLNRQEEEEEHRHEEEHGQEEEEHNEISPFDKQKHAEFKGEEEEEEEEKMHMEEKEFGKKEHTFSKTGEEEEEKEQPIEEKKGFFDSLIDKMKRPSTEGHTFNADVPISYVNNDRTLHPININVSYNNTKYDNDTIDEKSKVYANGMNYNGGKLQSRDIGEYQFDDGMKKKNAISDPVRVNDWMTKKTHGSVPKEKDLTDYFANYQKQMSQKMGDEGNLLPTYLDFRNKSASPQENVLEDKNKNKQNDKQLFYTPDGDTILNPDIWKGAFFGTDRPNYCPQQTKDGSNTCPILLNNFWSEWKTYPQK
jgi:hypothetical protein